MFGIGTEELLLILVIILLLFGGKKLPELARSIGTAFKEIRMGINGETDGKEKNKSSRKTNI